MPEEIEVPTEHLHEKMEEAAEHNRGWISRVAVSSALLAVAAAITALLASDHADEAILDEMKATDKWAQYQSKSIKQSITSGNIEQLKADGKPVRPEMAADVKRYDNDMAKIKAEADELEESSEAHSHHHVWFARGVTAFQIAIAMGAIAVLARRPKLWWVSLALGVAGIAGLILGFT